MIGRSYAVSTVKCLLLLSLACSGFAQQPAQQRGQGEAPAARTAGQARNALKHPPLFFKEDWQNPQGGQHPITAEVVSNPNLELKFYGPTKDGLVNGVAGDENNPVRLWLGTCATPCGVTLRDKRNYVDLTGQARIQWVTRVSGFHKVRPLLKLADGTLLVGDHGDGEFSDYHETEFSISDVHWMKLDSDKVVTKGDFLDKVDLSKVDEVGFVDLIPGSGHGDGGYDVLAHFAVYGKAVPRDAVQSRAN